MRPLTPFAGGLAAIALLTAAVAAAQPALDPMEAYRHAPAFDALLGAGPAPDAEAEAAAAAPDPAAVYDPMAAVAAAGDQTAPDDADTPDAAGAPDPDLGNLPAGPGAEETYYTCVACHSTAIILQQEITDERWDYLWHWMIEEQGMIEPDEETKELILSYLKHNFSSER